MLIKGRTQSDQDDELKPDPSNIARMIRSISEIGADAAAGISRLAFTQDERAAHELVGGWLRELGLEVHEDAIGNTIARRRGTAPGLPDFVFGSHLDSVPHGGQFDGIAGVVSMVEVMRVLQQSQVYTRHPLTGIVFAAEEGARFGEPCIGSKAIAGQLEDDDLTRIRDARGVTLDAAIRSVGFDPSRLGEVRWEAHRGAVFLELHIEQGRVLESENLPIGLVDVVSGSTRLRMTVYGRAGHTGGTPMPGRADALAAAAEITLAVEGLANRPSYRGTRATVGCLDVYPNRITTIPGRVELRIDVRDVDSDRLRHAALEIGELSQLISDRRGVQLEAEVIADTSPAVLSIWLRRAIGQVCQELGCDYRFMLSGAGHDAQIMAALMASAIIFVPSKAGASHVPEEWSSASDIARGSEVLYHSILRVDALLARLHDQDAGT